MVEGLWLKRKKESCVWFRQQTVPQKLNFSLLGKNLFSHREAITERTAWILVKGRQGSWEWKEAAGGVAKRVLSTTDAMLQSEK